MDEMGLTLPPTHVDIAEIRNKYHISEREKQGGKKRQKKAANGLRTT